MGEVGGTPKAVLKRKTESAGYSVETFGGTGGNEGALFGLFQRKQVRA